MLLNLSILEVMSIITWWKMIHFIDSIVAFIMKFYTRIQKIFKQSNNDQKYIKLME